MVKSYILQKDLGQLKAGTLLTRHGSLVVAGSASFELTSVIASRHLFEPVKEKDNDYAMPGELALSL